MANGLTVNALARKAGLNPVALLRIELEQCDPLITTLNRLSNVLSVPIGELTGFDSLPENTFAERLKKFRLMMGMNKAQFALYLNVNVKTVYFWEKGNHKPNNQILRLLKQKEPILFEKLLKTN